MKTNFDFLQIDDDYPVKHYDNHYIKNVFLPFYAKLFDKESYPNINDFLSKLDYSHRKQSYENCKSDIAKAIKNIASFNDVFNQIKEYFTTLQPVVAYHLMNSALGKLTTINDNLNIERTTTVPADDKKIVLFLCDSTKPLIIFPNGGPIILKY